MMNDNNNSNKINENKVYNLHYYNHRYYYYWTITYYSNKKENKIIINIITIDICHPANAMEAIYSRRDEIAEIGPENKSREQ